MFYTYEGSIIRESEGGYTVAVPSFECMVAGGTSVKEALDNDEPLPEATFGEAPQLVLCVEVGDGFIRESLCMTLAEAAEELGVSPGRVDQLLDSGQLVAAYPTGKRMVTISSVNECKRSASRLDNLCRSVSDNS